MTIASVLVTLVLVLTVSNLVCCVSIEPAHVDVQFADFTQKFNRAYSKDELPKRKKLFQDNIKLAQKHSNGDVGHTASFGMTNYSDWTQYEIQSHLLGTFDVSSRNVPSCQFASPTLLANLPASVDWRDRTNGNNQPVLTPIKNQGECGSCWAFSGTEVIESSWIMANRTMIGTDGSLSVMRVIECAGLHESNRYCNGGISGDVFEYAQKYAVPAEAVEPYKCFTRGACDSPTCTAGENLQPTSANGAFLTDTCTRGFITPSGANCSNCTKVDEAGLMYALDKYGPISVGVDARAWYQYQSGVIRNHCEYSTNHAVVLVGYGSEIMPDGVIDYWIVRNSWGPEWGENGYVRLYRDETANTCNVMSQGDVATSVANVTIKIPSSCGLIPC